MLPVHRRPRGGRPWRAALGGLLIGLMAAGCAVLEGERGLPEDPPPLSPAPAVLGPVVPAIPAELPPEAQSYLGELARAFAAQDRAFLIGQGEIQYEAELRPRWDEESYLAMLYRCGDQERGSVPRLDPGEIRELEFLDWEERGPLLEIRGNLITTGGVRIPCAIVFNPRLTEPRILGRYP